MRTLKVKNPAFEDLNIVRLPSCSAFILNDPEEFSANFPSYVWRQHEFAIPWTTKWVRTKSLFKARRRIELLPRDLRKLGMNLIPFPRVRFYNLHVDFN